MKVELKSEGSSGTFCAYRDPTLISATLEHVNQNCMRYVRMYTELLYYYGEASGVLRSDLDLMFQYEFKCEIGEDQNGDSIIDFDYVDNTLIGSEKEMDKNKVKKYIVTNDSNLKKTAAKIDSDDII